MPTKTRIIETDRFQVETESGEQFTVIEQTEQVGIDALGSLSTRWENSMRSYRCNVGSVNRVSEVEYEIVSKGQRATRV